MQQALNQGLGERIAFLASLEGMLLMDKGGTVLLANPAIEQLLGRRRGELIGRRVGDLLPPAVDARHRKLFQHQALDPGSQQVESVRGIEIARPDGRVIVVDISLLLWHENGRASSVAFIRDVSDYKQQVDRLLHQATHDPLTGLPNRWLFRQHLDQALARSARERHRVAVMYLDLDDFKRINDTLGHTQGDVLLMQLASRLSSVVRESDMLARLGGDEFAILLSDIVSTADIMAVAAKLLATFEVSYQLGSQEVCTAGSLGIAVYPDDARDAQTLLDCADAAMYEAKRIGRGNYARHANPARQDKPEDVIGPV